MLVQKLLRIDEAIIREVEVLATKLSEKEYTSFSSLIRKLIRLGLDNMENQSFIESVRKASGSKPSIKERVMSEIKKDIKRMADSGSRYCVQYPETFRKIIANAMEDSEFGDVSRVDFDTYHEMLYHMMTSLKKEGFQVSASFKTFEDGCLTGLYFHIEW